MSEKLEQVIEAIRLAEQAWWDADDDPVASLQETLARAAIEAMRDPTPRMLKAACASMSPGKRPTPDRVNVKEKHRIRYGAMIDAALHRC